MSDTYHPYDEEMGKWKEPKTTIQPFNLSKATSLQKDALRDLAVQSGFKDLRGYANWLKAANLNYYDIIKIASPE